jgi:hypothetical protein
MTNYGFIHKHFSKNRRSTMKKQQGDVIIRNVTEIPDGAVRVKRTLKGFVLAEGEATGHAHRIVEHGAELYEKDGILYIKVEKPVQVKHEEHKPITLTEGIYRVGHVREYDPFKEEARRIVD